MIKNYLLCLVLSCCIGGCASFWHHDEVLASSPQYKKPYTIDQSFDISGRFTISRANKNHYGNFKWSKISQDEALDFKTPLGQTLAQIRIESGIATLTMNGKTYTGTNLDMMLEQKLGFTLPLNYLHYWIQGVALPNVATTYPTTDGFSQLGWQIEYLAWTNANHPQIIRCRKNDIVIKLFIEW